MNAGEALQEYSQPHTTFFAPTQCGGNQHLFFEQLAIELETYAQLEETAFLPVMEQHDEWQHFMTLAHEEQQQVRKLMRDMDAHREPRKAVSFCP